MNKSQEISTLEGLPLWKNRKIAIAPMRGGMTNHNYLVTDRGKKYVARFAPKTTKLLHLNRKSEIYNYNVASRLGIGPKTIAHYPRHRLLIVKYLEGRTLNPRMARNPAIIRKVARVLRKLHRGPRLGNVPSPFTRARSYIQQAKDLKTWLPRKTGEYLRQLYSVEKVLGKLSKVYPCHTDMMLQNILVTTTGSVKLLDWEYASNTDYRYDLAMLSIKGGFQTREDKMLVRAYAGKNPEKLYSDIQIMKAVVYFAEAAYGVLQNAISDKNVDYKKYALMNFRCFEKRVRKEISTF